MRRSIAAVAVLAAMLCIPGAAQAASTLPVVTTGAATAITSQSARVTGSVNPGGTATTDFFEYGTTKAYGAVTTGASPGAGTAKVSAAAIISGLAPATTYHYRLRAHNLHGTVFGADRTFKTKAQPLGLTLAAAPNPVALGAPAVLGGTLSGTGSAGHQVLLQSNPFPYTQGFAALGNAQVTNAQGAFAFALVGVPINTQYRVVVPDKPAVVSPIVTVGVAVLLKTRVSTQHPRARHKVHFSGTIRPGEDGARLAIQKQRGTQWVTVAGSVARHGGQTFSSYGVNVRIRHSGNYRVFVLVNDGRYVSATGRVVKIRLRR